MSQELLTDGNFEQEKEPPQDLLEALRGSRSVSEWAIRMALVVSLLLAIKGSAQEKEDPNGFRFDQKLLLEGAGAAMEPFVDDGPEDASELFVPLDLVDAWLEYLESPEAMEAVRNVIFVELQEPIMRASGNLQERIGEAEAQQHLEGIVQDAEVASAEQDFNSQVLSPLLMQLDAVASGTTSRYFLELRALLREVRDQQHSEIHISDEGTPEGLQQLSEEVFRSVSQMTYWRGGQRQSVSVRDYYLGRLEARVEDFMDRRDLQERSYPPQSPEWYASQVWRSIPRPYLNHVAQKLGDKREVFVSDPEMAGEPLAKGGQGKVEGWVNRTERALAQVVKYCDAPNADLQKFEGMVHAAVAAFADFEACVIEEERIEAKAKKEQSSRKNYFAAKADRRVKENELRTLLSDLESLGGEAEALDDQWEVMQEALDRPGEGFSTMGHLQGRTYQVDQEGNLSSEQMDWVVERANALGVNELLLPSLTHFSAGSAMALRHFTGQVLDLPALKVFPASDLIILGSGPARSIKFGTQLPFESSLDSVGAGILQSFVENQGWNVSVGGERLSSKDLKEALFTPEQLAEHLQELIGQKVGIQTDALSAQLVIHLPNGEQQILPATPSVLLEADELKARIADLGEMPFYQEEFAHQDGESWERNLWRVAGLVESAQKNRSVRDKFLADIQAQLSIDLLALWLELGELHGLTRADHQALAGQRRDLFEDLAATDFSFVIDQMGEEAQQLLEEAASQTREWTAEEVAKKKMKLIRWFRLMKHDLPWGKEGDGARTQVQVEIEKIFGE